MPITWLDFSPEEKCILVSAAEHALLGDVLASWEPDLDWIERISHVRRLAIAINDLNDRGFVEVFKWMNAESNQEEEEAVKLSGSSLWDIVSDHRYWWTEDGPIALVELAPTDESNTVLATASRNNVFDFKSHQ